MEYLSVKEVAELKGCSERYIQNCISKGKLEATEKLNDKGKTKFWIPVSALPEEIRAKYHKQKQQELGLLPELAEPPLKQRSNSVTKEKIADIWYDGYGSSRNSHYNVSRYHGLNLHAVFTKGTVEFRLFNSTTHAGKLKAYIQFCLAVNNQALTQRSASPRITVSGNERYTFRTWLLRLGLIGDEFKTARKHLLANLDGDIAWRYSA